MVRVTPSELSCIDPDFQEQRWGGIGTRRNKDAALQRVSMSPTAALSTVDHDLHRRRRAPLQNFFSKQSITQLEPFVQVKVDKMVEMLKSACEQGTVLATQDVYGALTTDVISHYAYGESFGFLDDDKNFKNDFLRDISGFLVASHYLKHFSVLLDIVQMIPDHVLLYLHSGMASMLEIINISKSYARKTLHSMNDNEMQKKMLSKPLTIFHALADPSLPAEERSFARLTDEGIVIITAGLETTARFLTNITAHLLSNPAILSKLRAELKTVMTTPDTCVPWTTLENLPYMVHIPSLPLTISSNAKL
jgi:cytochrome P450